MTYNVLIVDDSEIIRAVIMKTIKLAEVSCQSIETASNGEEALEIMNRWCLPDIVFADINMPKMNGVQMIQQMKRSDNLKNIPIFMISSDSNVKTHVLLDSLGVKRFIKKPFKPEQIKELFDELKEVAHA